MVNTLVFPSVDTGKLKSVTFVAKDITMSQKHKRVLTGILQEPVSGNIHWRDIESLLHHLGAEIEHGHGARLRVILNGCEGTLRRPHHSGVCSKHDVRHLREFLISAGINLGSLDSHDSD